MKKNAHILLVAGTFAVLTAWFGWANITGDEDQMALFSDSYWILPLICGLIGLSAAKKWGGFKSVFGKALSFLSIGLLAQVFGQVVYSYYALIEHVEAPYPSVGDIGFFGAVIAYIAGAYYLSKTVGVRMLIAKPIAKVVAVAVPVAMLAVSYYLFLDGYDYDSSDILTRILDFGYPLGQAIYVAIAVIAFALSRSMLGGVMRSRILLVLVALAVQYLADFYFLYSFSRDTYIAGGISDALYLLAYILMGVSLIGLIGAYDGVLNKTKLSKLEAHDE